MDLRALSTKDTKQPTEDPSSYPRILKEPLLPTTKLIYDDGTREPSEMNANEDSTNPSFAGVTVPSSIVSETGEDDDDPPPYTAIAPPNHVGWPFDFSSSIPYSVRTETPCRAEAPLAPFQTSLMSGSSFHPEGADGQHTSISSMPLMPCRFFRFGSHRSLFMQRNLPFTDDVSATKDRSGRTRRYGAILVGAAVIVFLMVLSLMVRLVVEKSFWRG